MSELGDSYATPVEATLALAALTAADLARLGRIAQLRAHGIPGLSWEDLVNDALERLLSGVRRWPKEVPILVFLREVIRSLASEERRRHVQAAIVTFPADRSEEGADPLALLPDTSPGPEQELIARDLLTRVASPFSGDAPVLGILAGLAEGLSAQEIQRRLGMSLREYETCRRRLRRGLARHFPEGFAG